MITLEKAKIVTNHQVTGQQLKNKFTVVSILSEAVAEELDAAWLFDPSNNAREGYKALDLEAVMNGAVFTHKIEKIGTLTLPAVTVSRFRAFRINEGKKKSKKLMLSMVVEHGGAPFELIEHLIKVGRGEGLCTVKAPEVAQMSIVTNPQDKDVKRVNVVKADGPVAKYKSNNKSFSAQIFVSDCDGGFCFGYVANVGPSKLVVPVSPENAVCDTENGAISLAAFAINTAAKNLGSKAKGEQKREATALAEWAEKFTQVPLAVA